MKTLFENTEERPELYKLAKQGAKRRHGVGRIALPPAQTQQLLAVSPFNSA